MRELATSHDIPSHFLDDPAVVEACRGRDFSVIFTKLRSVGIYHSRIARVCDLTLSRVGEVATGKRAINQMSVIERIADGLGIPGAMLGLAPRPWENAVSPESVSPPTQWEDEAALELRRELMSAASADVGLACLFAAQVENARQLDRRLGAGALLPQLHTQIDQMVRLLRFGAAPGAREAIAAVATQAATLAGWQALDLGRYREAWDLHEMAKAAAREAGRPDLLAHATAQQAYVRLDLGQPHEAVGQIQEAHISAAGVLPPLMSTWLFAAEAEAHAAAQDERSCRETLDLADKVKPNDPNDPDLPFLFLEGSHLDRWRGNCLATLGADEALTDLTKALSSMGDFTRAKAGVRCDLAVVLAHRGEVDEARTHAKEAHRLAALTGSHRQRRRIARILIAA